MKPHRKVLTLALAAMPLCHAGGIWGDGEAPDGTAQAICAQKNINVINAVSKFCQGDADGKVMVPSDYAYRGMTADHTKTSVRITGTCDPISAYVPYSYCVGQFYHLCAYTGDENGVGTQQWGQYHCQQFEISPPNHGFQSY